MKYFFHQSGSIPGIPGTFANCCVEVAEDSTLTITPLPLIPHGQAALPAEMPPAQEETPVEQLQTLEQEVQAALAEVQPAGADPGEAQA